MIRRKENLQIKTVTMRYGIQEPCSGLEELMKRLFDIIEKAMEEYYDTFSR